VTGGAGLAMRTGAILVVFAVAAACGAGPTRPASLNGANDACRHCRMAVSNQRFAAQIVAPGEEPLFFDDIGCLSTYVQQTPGLARDAVAYVADHRTGEWVPAGTAIFTSVPGLDTPMASHLIAHDTAESRDADPLARGGSGVRLSKLFPGGVPEGRR
jgi:copper chaperone NosL